MQTEPEIAQAPIGSKATEEEKHVSFCLSKAQNVLNKLREHAEHNEMLQGYFWGPALPGSRKRKLKSLLKQGRLSRATYENLMFGKGEEVKLNEPSRPKVPQDGSNSLLGDMSALPSEVAGEHDLKMHIIEQNGASLEQADTTSDCSSSSDSAYLSSPSVTLSSPSSSSSSSLARPPGSILKPHSIASSASIQHVAATDEHFAKLGDRFLKIRNEGAVFVKYKSSDGNPELRRFRVGLDGKNGWYITWSRLKNKKEKAHYARVFRHVVGAGEEEDEGLLRGGNMAAKSASFGALASSPSSRADGKFARAVIKSLSFTATSMKKEKNPFKQSLFPSFKLSRKLYLCDILLVRQNINQLNTFRKFVANPDAKPWLAFQLVFGGRKVLSLVAANTEQMKLWFLGIQSLSPLNRYNTSEGKLLWQVLVKKLSYYGLDVVRDYIEDDGKQIQDNAEDEHLEEEGEWGGLTM